MPDSIWTPADSLSNLSLPDALPVELHDLRYVSFAQTWVPHRDSRTVEQSQDCSLPKTVSPTQLRSRCATLIGG